VRPVIGDGCFHDDVCYSRAASSSEVLFGLGRNGLLEFFPLCEFVGRFGLDG
jgi:hypothetical protein